MGKISAIKVAVVVIALVVLASVAPASVVSIELVGASPGPSEIHVNPDGWWNATAGETAVSHPSDTPIQSAIDAASDGDIIIVHEGTYDEQVIIDKALTLQGFGDATVIKPTQETANNFQLFARKVGGTANTAPIIVVQAGPEKEVTIKDLKVNGSLVSSVPPGANAFVGILYLGTGGTIDSVTIDSLLTTQSNGIYLSSLGETVAVEVKGCTISNFLKNGITANFEGLTASIHNNVVIGSGPIENIAQNGIQIGYGATGSIFENEVSNIAYTGGDWIACGILLFDWSGTVTITGNIVTDCQGGIIGQTMSSGSYKAIVSGNTVSATGLAEGASCVGIYFATWAEGASIDATIEGNDLTGGGPGDGIATGSTSEYGPAGTVNALITDNEISG